VEDSRAVKASLAFFNRRLNLGLDLTPLDLEIKRQNERFGPVKAGKPPDP
jgi:hypothetical protein